MGQNDVCTLSLMAIIQTYINAYPALVKFSAGCPTEQSCPVMRALFVFTDHMVRGLEQLRLLYPGFPVLRGSTAHREHFADFRQKGHRMLEQAGVYKGIKDFHPFVEGALLQPDYSQIIGDISPIRPWVECLLQPESLIDVERAVAFEQLEALVSALDGANEDQTRHLLLQIRITAELEMELLSHLRDRLVALLNRAEQMVNSIRQERMQRSMPPPGAMPVAGSFRQPVPAAPVARNR